MQYAHNTHPLLQVPTEHLSDMERFATGCKEVQVAHRAAASSHSQTAILTPPMGDVELRQVNQMCSNT